MNKPVIYCSHSIRGDGSVSIEENCKRAQRLGVKLRKVFPEVDFYIPGENDAVMQILWKAGMITADQILWADCEYLKTCHGWFWWYSCPSEGCKQEADLAYEIGLADNEDEYGNVVMTDLNKANFDTVRRILIPIVEDAKRRALNG